MKEFDLKKAREAATHRHSPVDFAMGAEWQYNQERLSEKSMTEEDVANTNLIAAAPEMLEALINAASVLACFPGQEPEVQKLRDLIKKARGE